MTKKHEPHMPQKAHKQPRNHPWGFEKQKELKDLKKQNLLDYVNKLMEEKK